MSASFERRGQRRRQVRLVPEAELAMERILRRLDKASPTRLMETLLAEALFALEDHLDERGRLPRGGAGGKYLACRLAIEPGERRAFERKERYRDLDALLDAVP